MSDLDKHQIQQLIDGELSDHDLRNEVLPDPKDPERFEKVREVLQEKTDWDEPILVPLNDHLSVIGTDDGRIVRAHCGEDLCDLDENWKKSCEVAIRRGDELNELYPEYQNVAPGWDFELREWFCPNCYTLIDVDPVPIGYPVIKPFDPDIDAFYEEWLGQSAPDKGGKPAD